MDRIKRLAIATIMGLLLGFVCFGFAASGPGVISTPVQWQIITSRALIGVAIGISCFPLGHWAIHGLVMGFLFSLPLALGGLMAPETAGFSAKSMFAWTMMLGMVYGVLIELVTTVLLKARMRGQ